MKPLSNLKTKSDTIPVYYFEIKGGSNVKGNWWFAVGGSLTDIRYGIVYLMT